MRWLEFTMRRFSGVSLFWNSCWFEQSGEYSETERAQAAAGHKTGDNPYRHREKRRPIEVHGCMGTSGQESIKSLAGWICKSSFISNVLLIFQLRTRSEKDFAEDYGNKYGFKQGWRVTRRLKMSSSCVRCCSNENMYEWKNRTKDREAWETDKFGKLWIFRKKIRFPTT